MPFNKVLCASVIGLATVAIATSGCTEATQDRSDSAGGKGADKYSDATQVVVVRNIDEVPNVALFCAEGLRFAATLSGDGTRSPQLVRIPEQDTMCKR